MNFLPTSEHEMLAASIRRLVAERSPRTEVRRRAEARLPADESVWRRAAELGATGTLAAEARGGFGASAVETMVVSTEWGRALQLGAFIDTNVAAAAIDRAGATGPAERYLRDLVGGACHASWCHAAVDGSALGPPFVATPASGGGHRLHGTAGFVVDASNADVFLVWASSAAGPLLLLVASDAAGVSIGAPGGLDLTRPMSAVTFDDVAAGDDTVIATGDAAVELVGWLRDLGAVLACADAVGAASAVIDETVAYAKQRVAFGRPIGSYQAIKHHCADMVVGREKSTVATWQAAIALRDGWPDRRLAVAVAKSVAGPACSAAVSQALQIFGGIGFTWEHDLHLYLRRVKTDELLYGDARHHRDVLATVGW